MTNRWPVFLGAVLGLAAMALAFSQPADLATQWQLAARWTARVGFPLLIAAYVARPLVQLWPSRVAKGLLARRRWVGLGFAISHTIHLYALIMALQLSGEERPLPVLIGGGLGYFLLYLMALTSSAASVRALGKWWKRLHRFGIHYLWFVFAFSYFGRLFDPDRAWIGMLFFPIAIGAALIRLLAWWRNRMKTRRAFV